MSSVLILGDSIVKNFDTVKFDTLYEDDGGVRGGVNVFSYPGINAAKLAVQISVEKLPDPDTIGLVIVHVGTNDASRQREDKSIDVIGATIIDILDFLASIYHQSRVLFSAILPRHDEDDERGVAINGKLRSHCANQPNVEYFDACNKLPKSDVSMYRYGETKDLDFPDPVHLSATGVAQLQKSFTTVIRFHLKTIATLPKRHRVNAQKRDELRQQLNPHRHQARHQFKKTNYRPAMRDLGESMIRLDAEDDFFNIEGRASPVANTKPAPSSHYSPVVVVAPRLQQQHQPKPNANQCMPSRRRKRQYAPTPQPESSYTPVYSPKRAKPAVTTTTPVSAYTPCL